MLDILFFALAVGLGNHTGQSSGAAPATTATGLGPLGGGAVLADPATDPSMGGAQDGEARGRALGPLAGAASPVPGEVGPLGQPGGAATPPAETNGMAGLVAEPQERTGKFLTALEVKPILSATKPSWVAVRPFNGQDLLYLTQLWSWRCGLLAIRGSVNGAPLEDWPLPDCHAETAAPNAILEDDGFPWITLPKNSVERVTVELVYDDLTTDRAEYTRSDILMP